MKKITILALLALGACNNEDPYVTRSRDMKRKTDSIIEVSNKNLERKTDSLDCIIRLMKAGGISQERAQAMCDSIYNSN